MISPLRDHISFFLCLICLSVFAQQNSISGVVVDRNNTPIELANAILFKGEDQQFIKGTSTDEKGYFILENIEKGTYTISITYIGFKDFKQKVTIDAPVNLNRIQLTERSESLEAVTVVSRKPTITRQPDRLIFNVAQTALVENNTLSVLKYTPGVIINNGHINVKGASADVYINNRKVQLNAEELMQLLESAPAESITSVEVITNPPANYDADSGVVLNIKMNKNIITGYKGSLFSNYTQGVYPRYNIGTSHYLKNNSINFNLSYSYTNKKINKSLDDNVNYLNPNSNIEDPDNINQIWRSKDDRNTTSETHSLNLNLDYKLSETSSLSFTNTTLYTPYFNYDLTNRTTIFNPDAVPISSFTARNLSKDYKYNIGNDLEFTQDFKNGATFTINGHFTVYDYERQQHVFQDDIDDSLDSRFNTIAHQNTEIFSLKTDYSLPLKNDSSIDMGLKFGKVTTDSDILRNDIINDMSVVNLNNTNRFDYNENVFAAYTNYNHSWSKWGLSLGLRVEHSDIKGKSLTVNQTNTQSFFNAFPKFSLSHTLSDDLDFTINYNRSITRPNYKNLNPFTYFLNENNLVVGNPELVPTYTDNYRFAVNFNSYFTASVYYTNYDGQILELPRQNNQTNQISWTPVNLDKKVDYGFDFEFNYYPSYKFGLYALSSTYNISEENRFENDVVQQDQWSQLFMVTPYATLLKDSSMRINASFIWVSRSLENFQTIQPLFISSLTISKSVFQKKGAITLSVEDLFNAQDYDLKTRYLNQSNSTYIDIDNRFIKLGFRYKFGNTKLNTNARNTALDERDRL